MTQKWEDRESLMEEIETELTTLKKEYFQLQAEKEKYMQNIETLKNYIEINLSTRKRAEEEERKREEEERRRREEEGRRREEEDLRRKEEEGRRKEDEGRRRVEEGKRSEEEERRREEEERRREDEERREEEVEELRSHIETKTKILEDRNNFITILKGQLEEANLKNKDMREIIAKHDKKVENLYEKLQVIKIISLLPSFVSTSFSSPFLLLHLLPSSFLPHSLSPSPSSFLLSFLLFLGLILFF